jgi:ATPase subunit of ABC transporter with duplicated ATPase domains
MQKIITINELNLQFGAKELIADFSQSIYAGERIAIIGRNGSGKSSLLKILAQEIHDNAVQLQSGLQLAYVPQLSDNNSRQSGGERFNSNLSQALASYPDVLLLDEPTNHLDQHNRKSLIKLLHHFNGSLIIVSHDLELLNNCVDTLWHINHGRVTVFNGKYSDYLQEQQLKQQNLLAQVAELKQQQRTSHQSLMQEQQRAKNSRKQGEKSIVNRKWPTITSQAKARRAEMTAGQKQRQMREQREDISGKLADIFIHEEIIPQFNLPHHPGKRSIVQLSQVSIAYEQDKPLLQNVNLQISGSDKIVLLGANGSGKSSLFKALLRDKGLIITGEIITPELSKIGYLDQHYANLAPELSAVEIIADTAPQWTTAEIRNHLNSFLLRKNEEVLIPCKYLSGGELVRLSLATIAANPPVLLLLDEISNNLDIETKQHVLTVLNNYPGAYLLICHEGEFVAQLNLDYTYQIKNRAIYTKTG